MEVVNGLGSQMPGLKVQLLIGGTSTDEDAKMLKTEMPQIVVGCPGRVYDMIRRKYINAKQIKMLVLDEADEM